VYEKAWLKKKINKNKRNKHVASGIQTSPDCLYERKVHFSELAESKLEKRN